MASKRTRTAQSPRVIMPDFARLAASGDKLALSGDESKVVMTAAAELAGGLHRMMHGGTANTIRIGSDQTLEPRELRIVLDPRSEIGVARGKRPLEDSFAVQRHDGAAISIRAGSARGLLHGATATLQKLGARFAPGVAPEYPRIDRSRLSALDSFSLTPSFGRRGFVSDIMTWNYRTPERLAAHLRHDREFIPWMGRRGINAFSYIRHAHDSQLRIGEIVPLYKDYGIAAEYGGHVLQILLPREQFAASPSMFPADNHGQRFASGNLCVSNPQAVELVRSAALAYVSEFPENELLHIWGADVSHGAWCHCGDCRELPPQLQYMQVVNAIAESLAERKDGAPPVAYLAYHDTIEPHPDLRPQSNVWVEWAPRERCYSHAIDDPDCERNPALFDSLRRYIEIFDGRAHVFEYYADSILFGGLSFATPATIARDLRAYKSLGIDSITCLTFGAFSTLAYPVNLETFVRCASDVNFDPELALEDAARGRHPACSQAMARAYRAVEHASRLVLDYGDVMHPRIGRCQSVRKITELKEAARAFEEAEAAAQAIGRSARCKLAAAERKLWHYSAEITDTLADYLSAKFSAAAGRLQGGASAIDRMNAAVSHMRDIAPEYRGTWGEHQFEYLRELWLEALRRGLRSDKTQS